MNNFRKQANYIYYKIVSVGILFFSLFAVAAFLLQKNIWLLLSSSASNLVAACNCSSYLTFSDRPDLFVALFLSSLVLAIFLIHAFIKYLSLKLRTSRYVNKSLNLRRNHLSSRANKVAQELDIADRVVEINSPDFNVFCYGLFSPKICISKSISQALSRQELKAVLLHEKHHLVSLDTLKLFIVRFISETLVFLPQLKLWSRKYYALTELAADQFAIDELKSKSYLASAMYKFLKSNELKIENNNLALASFNILIAERINKMRDSNYELKLKSSKKKLVPSTLAILLLAFIFIFSIKASASFAASKLAPCAMETSAGLVVCGQGVELLPCHSKIDNSNCHFQEKGTSAYLKHLE